MKRCPLFAAAMFLAGSAWAEENPSFYIEQALVHRVPAAGEKREYPVIMVPGMNLSSYIYLATPDGREGWAQQFAAAGYDVYVINDPRFDFSRGFGVPGFEGVPKVGAPPANPAAQQGWGQDVWRRWGFGTSEGNPYPDSQFPSEHIDRFEANYPYLSTADSSFAEAVGALLEKVGPAILMAHSAAGPQAVSAAKAHPEQVAGLVLVEPTGPPTPSDFPRLTGISMLGIYADYVDSRRQSGRKAATEEAAALFAKNGGIGEVISLPDDLGVKGNSHLMMQGRNNDFISGVIIRWLGENAKTPAPGTDRGDDGEAAESAPGRGRRGGKGGRFGGKGQRPGGA